ncbi:RNA polymerase sigma factor [Cytobacillus solani]|uniref:RNA polymerase subunit sigma-70 n=1 Tax=Cytobacillus solani TaxID=1637975 RepID=A0A0Q3SQX6_9BACI|nr:RNA polymerase sigma factor [Cytobacillus solani]KOP84009.1 RNA polymerase subunit sigma-70 [Bacillus sp. FJAT-21945]KQL21948.1 RNA polymerase subunit sigma-70 [Cytobacillus solani]USK57584.1 RNA polymerase sigma factor [Cytobacillus solani]
MIAYQNGDDDALAGIYTLLKPALYSFIYRYTRDQQLSIDIVQDSFVKLQRYKHHYHPGKGKIKSYLFQIAYRLLIDKLNRRKKWQSFMPFLTPITKEELHHTDRLTIREAISNLPDKQRAVILLFYYHDMKHEEIAEILTIPKGTVKSRLHTAIQSLKVELEDDFNESRSL